MIKQSALFENPPVIPQDRKTCENGHAYIPNLAGMCPHCYGGTKPEPSIELLFPDGRGSGFWCCGKCKALKSTTRGMSNFPDSDFNRGLADRCCTLNICLKCKLPIPKSEDVYSYTNWHKACEPPKPAPIPDHPSMTAEAWDLYEAMSDISEDRYCAGWYLGIEYILWNELTDNSLLRVLAERAGGWCVWDDVNDGFGNARLISFEEMEKRTSAKPLPPPSSSRSEQKGM